MIKKIINYCIIDSVIKPIMNVFFTRQGPMTNVGAEYLEELIPIMTEFHNVITAKEVSGDELYATVQKILDIQDRLKKDILTGEV